MFLEAGGFAISQRVGYTGSPIASTPFPFLAERWKLQKTIKMDRQEVGNQQQAREPQFHMYRTVKT